jgi:hypothetical protein
MGGAGDLLSLALSVPPWEDLHELDTGELKLTYLVTTDLVADVLPHVEVTAPAMAELVPKTQARFGAEPGQQQPARSTKTAEAVVPTGAAPSASSPK